MNKLISVSILLLFILIGSFLIASDKSLFSEKTSRTVVATDSNDAELYDAEGNSVDFKSFNGKVVFVNNWASWCPPCIAEMPTIEQLKEVLPADEVAFVMISFDKNPSKALNWMKKKDIDLPVYFPGSNFPKRFITISIPATFILDAKGKLLYTQIGMADYSSKNFVAQMHKWINE